MLDVSIGLWYNVGMERILILGREKGRFIEFAEKLQKEGFQANVTSSQDLGFWLDGERSSVVNLANGTDLKEYRKILVLSTPEHAKNHILSAAACYCHKNHIEMYDDSFTNLGGKLYAMWRFWEEGITIPKTAFGSVEFLKQKLPEVGGVGVLKSINGSKGRDNYLVRTGDEIQQIVEQNPEVSFILQNFIPNDGDYRIVVVDYQPKLAIYRSANGKDFRNNTSLGGEASLVPLAEVDARVIDLAVTAARALNIRLAGADILQNKETGEYSVLEVNRTPQLISGSFTDEKFEVLKELLQSR